jgi:hypothetical protein
MGLEPMEVEILSQKSSMDVEATPKVEEEEEDDKDEDEEELCSDLIQLMDEAKQAGTEEKVQILFSILLEDKNRYGPKASSIKEEAVYELARSYCAAQKYQDIVSMLTGQACTSFFDHITKAKCAKVVRGVLDLVCALAPEELEMVSYFGENL